MSCLRIKAAYPLTGHKVASFSLSQSHYLRVSRSCSFPSIAFNQHRGLPRLVCSSARYQGSATCLLGGGAIYENDDKVSPWNAMGQAVESFRKGPSVHETLRKQMKEQEFGGGGGSGRHRGGGGGDGSGDDGGGFSGHLNELLQILLATISFIVVYIYLIRREEMTRLSKDYIKYLLGGKPSPRLRRAMDAWGRFFQKTKGKEVEESSDNSEGAVDSSPW